MSKESVGRRGPRGLKGTRGAEGKRGAPGIEPAQIHAIIRSVEKLHDETTLTVKRIAQIQVQIDQTLKALKELGDRAGHQRKKR
jgi:hypothetical protein